MNNGERLIYEFGTFRLDPDLRLLLRDGDPVTVWPKVFDTLVLLLQSRGRLVEKEELMRALWPESFVEEGNLTQNIFVLRKILGDDRNGHGFIQTVPRRGYKFIAPVREEALATSDGDLPAAYWRGRSPFRGLQVFETEDAWLFFGRESETEGLLAQMRRSPVLSVVGNSGSGKSSLLRAGLIPALQQGRFCPNGSPNEQWRIATFRPSVAPLDYLAEVLPGQLAPELSIQERAEFIRDFRNKLSSGGDSLRNALAALAGAIPHEAGPTRILLLADQFEEIFTLTADRRIREAYIGSLLAAASTDGAVPVHVALAVRADFYPECMEHAELSRRMAANQYNVGRMSHEQLRESIEKRLQLASAQAEPGLIDSLLEDVGSEPGNLALLEHALGQLWDKCGGFACTLTNEAYAAIGRLRGALGRHADEVYAGLGDEAQKQLAKKIFLELVHLGDGAQDTRRRVPKADLLSLGKADEMDLLLAHLASRRLISTGEEDHESFVEVSHEALIREWPLLCEWLAQNRDDLRLERRLLQAADEWQSLDRERGALLQGARLAQAEEWLGRHAGAQVLLRDFVEAGVAARKEAQERELASEKAAAVRLRWFSFGLALLLVLAIALAGYAYRQKIIEKSRAMAAQSGELLQRDHGQALDLAIRSWKTAQTEEAHVAIAKALPETVAILRHQGPVFVSIYSPNGQLLLTASKDHTARVWNARDGRLLWSLQHKDQVYDANFSPDGEKVVTASGDRTAGVWSAADGRLLFTLRGHLDRVNQAEFSSDGRRIATASSDKTARIWDASTGRLLATLQGHTRRVGLARFSPDGQYVLTAGWDHTARIWNSTDGSLLRTLESDSELVSAAFSPDGQTFATGSVGGVVNVYTSDGHPLFTTQLSGAVSIVGYSRDSQRLLVGSTGASRPRVLNLASGRVMFSLAHDGGMGYARFSPDEHYIVTGGLDHVARVWSNFDGRLLAVLEGHSDSVFDATFSPNGRQVVTASNDGTARIWQISSGRSLSIAQGHSAFVLTAMFSKDGRQILTSSWDKTARTWNAADGRLIATLQHPDKVLYATFSPSGQNIITIGDDHTVRVWNADGRLTAAIPTDFWGVLSPDGQKVVTTSEHLVKISSAADGHLIATLQGHGDTISSEFFSPDGKRIITASFDRTARVWNAADGRLEFTLTGHTDKVATAKFSPDGRLAVTASYDHSARVWDSRDGHLLITLGHPDTVNDVEFSPDGQQILTRNRDDGKAWIWNAANGSMLATLQDPSSNIRTARFSPDGRSIITANKENEVRIWNSSDGTLMGSLQGHTANVWDARFSEDSQHIVTASLDSTARVWQLVTLADIDKLLGH